MKYILYYLLVINILTFFFMYIDKRKAIKGRWRISERKLYFLTFVGGSVAMLVSMSLFRHKVSKNSFKIVVYSIMILQAFMILYFIR